MDQKYTTNLTEQQYKSNYGRAVAFADRLRIKLKNREIEVDDYRNSVLSYAKRLKLLIKKDKTNKETIIHAQEIFGYKENIEPDEDILRKSDFDKDPDVVFPKKFVTVGERDAPCKIVYKPNVKNIMLGIADYSDKAKREVHYTLCETPKGIKISSPTFGQEGRVSRRTEKTKNKCPHEFGKNSKEIGEFHTHPGLGYEVFSVTDLISFSDDPFNYNNSNCVVSKVSRKGKENIRVRCTTGVDAQRFLKEINVRSENKDQETIINRVHDRFNRDPNLQNAFSCTVDIAKEKNILNKPKNKVQKSGYDREYGGKVVNYKKEKSSKNISIEAQKIVSRKPKPKIKSDESFLGLGAYL